jgi:transcriptional regulator
MYIPAPFAANESARLAAVMQQCPFATVVTQDGPTSFASHVPVLWQAGRGEHGVLVGHFARANPQWRHFGPDREVLVIFHGPHAYVSPTWYQTQPSVPTWNYVSVHAHGRARLIEEAGELTEVLRRTTDWFESGQPQPWTMDSLPADYLQRMVKGIVGFEIILTRVEGKFKLSQNRPPEDVAGVVAALSASDQPLDREVAALMSPATVTDKVS